MALGKGRHVWNVSQLATCPDLNPVMNQRVRCSLACSPKQEEIDGRNYRDLKRAREAIGVFIEDVYNRQRLHSARDPPSTRLSLCAFYRKRSRRGQAVDL